MDESVKQPLMFRITVAEGFRVPLHTKDKRMIRQFNAFNQSIRSEGIDPEVFPQRFDSLVVPAVNAQLARSHDGGQERIRSDIHIMHRVSGRVKPGVVQLRSELRRQILIERPAQDAGKKLHSAANSQDRRPAC